MPEAQVLQWAVQLCLALHHLSTAQIVHRDLKPANLLLSDNCSIIHIADFGLAKVLERGSNGLKAEVGTPLYMSPEICRNEAYGTATDVWSLGVIMHETFCLRVPFYGADDIEFVKSLTESEPPQMPSRYSAGTTELVRSMLTKDAASRPSASQLLVAPVLNKAAFRILSNHRPARIEPRLQRAQARLLQAQYERVHSKAFPGSTTLTIRSDLREPLSPPKATSRRRQEAGAPPRSPIYKARQVSSVATGQIRHMNTRPHSSTEGNSHASADANASVVGGGAAPRKPPVPVLRSPAGGPGGRRGQMRARGSLREEGTHLLS